MLGRFFLTTLLALSCTAQAQVMSTGDIIAQVVAPRTARLVSVTQYGQFYHRHDHLTQGVVSEITPEEAAKSGYARCPECLPPSSSAILDAETVSGRKLSKYYKQYLSEREKPTMTEPPPGALAEVYREPPPKIPAMAVYNVPPEQALIQAPPKNVTPPPAPQQK